ncbi:MAG: GNAT family N-acetyltransferase [Flavobacteriaceae bacterium]
MIQFLKSNDNRSWTQFLEDQQATQLVTMAHNPCLAAILAKTFGYRDENMLILEDKKIIGVLPAVSFRKKLVSIPHFSYGGPIFDTDLQSDVDLPALLAGQRFEIRSFSKLSDHVQSNKISCVLKVEANEEEQLLSLKPKLRTKIRKAEKLNYRVVHGGLELLDDFYRIYALKMLAFGSPPVGKVFFKNLLTDYEFGEASVTALYDGNKAIAAGMCLSYLGFNEVCWSATADAYDKNNVHSLICWAMAKNSIAKKHRYFSFGRSTIDSNNHHFKKQWNPIELPLYFNYSEPVGKSIREFGFLTKIWRLQPLKTSVFFGHIISKYLY